MPVTLNTSSLGTDMSNLLDFNLSPGNRTSTRFEATGSGLSAIFTGSGLQYDSSGRPSAGTLSSFEISTAGASTYQIHLDFDAFSAADAMAALGGSNLRAMLAFFLAGDDQVNGGSNADYLLGFSGADTINGNAGNDQIDGDAVDDPIGGDDAIDGGLGNDTIRGLGGNDEILGGAGDDDVNGNKGADTVYGGSGRDIVRGGQGDDIVYGDDGNDFHVNGNIGNDTVYGGTGSDAVFGGQNEDLMYGESGNDTMSGDLGNDTMYGGTGADWFAFRAGSGADRVEDFSFDEGDRVQLAPGTAYTVVASGADAVIRLTGTSDTLTLVGVTASSVTASYVVFA